MSEQYRRLGEDAELQQLRTLNLKLAVFTAASNAYFGEFPPALSKRLADFMEVKKERAMPLSVAKLMEQVIDVVNDFKKGQAPK